MLRMKTKQTKKIKQCNFKRITLKSSTRPYSKRFDIADIHYNSPIKRDLAVGFVYFNAVKSKRILMNYLYCAEKMKTANIPFYTLEMYETTPEIHDAIHLKTDFTLFQKERLCHILESCIPKQYTKLLFLDSDLLFENQDWYNELSAKLDSFEIVQPFSKGVWLDITYKHIVKERIPFVFYNKFGKITMKGGIGGYHPGFAWAFQRPWFRKVGFFQESVLGDGDTLSTTVWLDYEFEYKDYIKPAIEAFRKKLTHKPSMCFLQGAIFHLWHGDGKKRQYSERRKIFKSIKDIRDILLVAPNGLYEITDSSLKPKILKYFRNRDDDGLSVDR